MLTDAILKEATAEAERFLLSIVPEDVEPHVFSKQFERKMQKLIRRVNHPIRYQVLRAAAAVVLVIATLFGTVMAVSPEARAAVVGWIKETFDIYQHYTPSTTVEDETKYDYFLSKVPDGYVLLKEVEREDGKVYIYRGTTNLLQFIYTYAASGNGIFIEAEGCDIQTIQLGNVSAEIYITTQEGKNNEIIWQSENGAVAFHISANLNQDDLIALANSVQKKEK